MTGGRGDGDGAVRLLTTRGADGSLLPPPAAGSRRGRFAGFRSRGPGARSGAEAGTFDVGLGLDPGRLGQGLAAVLLPEVVQFAVGRSGARRLRAAVAALNERSLRLSATAGFRAVREFTGPGGRRFVELVLALPR